jgi:regulator of sirC expression with transglutaminase-like and TPR domain
MIAIDPQDPDGWNSRGNLYHDLGEYDKAIADFTHCIPPVAAQLRHVLVKPGHLVL